MIELPYFKEENWYLEMIKKVLVDARFKDENKRRTAYANKLENINQLIAEIVDETYFSSEYEEYTLFEKLVLAPYSDLEKIYRKIYNNADDIFLKEIVDKNGGAEMVLFNRCEDIKPLAGYRRSVKVVSPQAEVIFEDEQGEVENIL